MLTIWLKKNKCFFLVIFLLSVCTLSNSSCTSDSSKNFRSPSNLKPGFNLIGKNDKIKDYNPYMLSSGDVLFLHYANPKKSLLFKSKTFKFIGPYDLSQAKLEFLPNHKIRLGNFLLVDTNKENICSIVKGKIDAFRGYYCAWAVQSGGNKLLVSARKDDSDIGLVSYDLKTKKMTILDRSKETIEYSQSVLPDGNVYLTHTDRSKIAHPEMYITVKLYNYKKDKLMDLPSPVVKKLDRAVTATLSNGKVFILYGPGEAQIYDPLTGHYQPAGKAHSYFSRPSLVELKDHKILLVAGQITILPGDDAEIYSPATKQFTKISTPSVHRNAANAIHLQDDSVLITGGFVEDGDTVSVPEIELFKP
jgi:hypothetical protein